MLVPVVIAALLFLQFAAAADATVDLTPTPAEYIAEGIKFQQLLFKDNKQLISYDLPREWTYRYDGGRIVLTPPEAPFAEALIEALSMEKPEPFDDAIVKALEQRILTSLPPNSDGIAILKTERNPVILNRNLSFEIVVSYRTLGETFQRSVLFINTPGTRLIFKLSARKSDFDKVYSAFRASVLTWQWLGPASLAGLDSHT
ncbi:MAG: hypothetical protein ABR514_06900 [Chthoniobacterales bacterium]